MVDLSLSPNDHNNYDGLRVLDAVRRVDPNCQTILLTGFATVELAVTALTDYGAFTFLRKESFHRSQFRDIINRVLLSAPHLSSPTSVVSNTEISTPPAKAKTVTTRQSAERALVVEDDAGWRSILEEHLVDAGFSVRVCSSFGDALGFLRRERYTLAVIDLSLKVRSVTRGIRTRPTNLRKDTNYLPAPVPKAYRQLLSVVSRSLRRSSGFMPSIRYLLISKNKPSTVPRFAALSKRQD